MGKVINLFILLFFTVNTFCQNKIIIPKNGIIVFKCIEEIYNKEEFESSKKEFSKSFFNGISSTVKKERENANTGKVTDSINMNKLIQNNIQPLNDFLFTTLSKKDSKFYVDYQDSIVNKVEVVKGLEETSLYINCKTKKFDNGFTEGYYDFSKNKIKELKEDRKSIKTINGYKCFKVIYTFSDSDSSELSSLISSYTNTREMWVTDKIKSDFHPIINDKEIMTKYYPLEILEYSDMLKGVRTHYIIEQFNLQ